MRDAVIYCSVVVTAMVLVGCDGRGTAVASSNPTAAAVTAPAPKRPMAEGAVELDQVGLIMGTVNPSELAITLRGKDVKFTDVPTSVDTVGNTTVAALGPAICEFTEDDTRLFASRMKARTPYKFVGRFAGISGSKVRLTDCIATPS